MHVPTTGTAVLNLEHGSYCTLVYKEITDIRALILRASLYIAFASRSIIKVLLIESYEFARPRGRYFTETRRRTPRGRHSWRKFTKIYENPRSSRAGANILFFRNQEHSTTAAKFKVSLLLNLVFELLNLLVVY
jgi:hypothetical protein